MVCGWPEILALDFQATRQQKQLCLPGGAVAPMDSANDNLMLVEQSEQALAGTVPEWS